MKIAHINTYLHGGAANAAFRLHQSLLDYGMDSSFLHREPGGNKAIPSLFTAEKRYPSLTQRILLKTGMGGNPAFRSREKPPGSTHCDVYTSMHNPYRLDRHNCVKGADIVHLHWIGDFVDYPSFFSQVDKPMVWTCHDRNPILGGLHLETDRKRDSGLNRWDRALAKQKESFIRRCEKLHVVAPSISLLERFKSSFLSEIAELSHIPNPLDTTFFHPLPKKQARAFLDLPEDKTIIGFLSNYPGVHHKGADMFWDAIKHINGKSIHIACNGSVKVEKENVHWLGMLEDNYSIRVFLNAVDAVVISSREENLPGVMLESLSCGTPVIATPVGGMKDWITPEKNGLLARDTNADALAEAIRAFDEGALQSLGRGQIREETVSRIDKVLVAEKYAALYRSMI